MKLFKYNQFNESNSFNETKEIIQTIKDICEELSDENIEWLVFPNDDIRIKILGLKIYNLTELPIDFYVEINIEDSVINSPQGIGKLSSKQKSSIIKTFSHLENYSTSLGIPFYYWYQDINYKTGKTVFKVSGGNVNRQPGEPIDKHLLFEHYRVKKYRFYFNI